MGTFCYKVFLYIDIRYIRYICVISFVIINGRQINSIWKNNKIPRNNIIVDGSYETVDQALILEKIFPLYWRWLSAMKLTKWAHKWDCDNFSEAFRVFSTGYYAANINSNADTIAIGIIHYMSNSRNENGTEGPHAINIAISAENNLITPLFLEPQNGKIITLKPEEYQSIWLLYI